MLSVPALGILLSERSIIDVDASIFVQFALFVLLFLLLKQFVFGPLNRLFEAREKAIDGVRLDAKAMQAKAQAQVEILEVKLNEVRANASRERERLRNEGLELERDLLSRVREESQRTLNEARERLHHEEQQLRATLRGQVPLLGRQIAQKVLGRELGT